MKKKIKVSIILVEPENPDNIGAAARALKNTGFSDLRVVKPPENWRRLSKKMAMSAFDVLQKAREFKNVKAAVADRELVIGATRRRGPQRGRFLELDEAVRKILQASRRSGAAVLFGKESKGLDNASLALCDWAVTLPASPDYPSFNLAQAVMVFAFSIFNHRPEANTVPPVSSEPFAPKKEMEEVLSALRPALKALGYGSVPGLLERVAGSYRRLLKRSGLLESEARMFKGMARRVVERIKD